LKYLASLVLQIEKSISISKGMPSKWQTKLTSYIHESMKSWFNEKKQDPHGSSNGLSNHGSASTPPTGPYRRTLIGTTVVKIGSGRAKRSLKMDPNAAKLAQIVRCSLL